MKRFLIRAGFNPLTQYTAKDFQIDPLSIIGNNNGNFLFAYGVMNALWKDDVEIDQFYNIKESYSEEEVNHINKSYDAFIIPMADAFRPDYMEKLSWYTKLIKKLKIPCIVIGIGYRGHYNPVFDQMDSFNDTVKDFCSAVLDHSSLIGLRGEITGQYLSRLGFKEDRHFTPIGCPSLYTYGILPPPSLPNSSKELIKGKLCLNYNNLGPYLENEIGGKKIADFLNNTLEAIPNHYLIQQIIYEFEDMYIGHYSKWRRVHISNIFRKGTFERLAKEDRIRFFLDVPSWLNFIKDADIFVGSRFHGTVVSVLASVPHVFLSFNARTREMSEFHHLTCLSPDKLDLGKSILDYLDNLDFMSFYNNQQNNLNHYVAFLKRNSLDSIFNESLSWPQGTSPMEKKMPKHNYPLLRSIESLSPSSKQQRILTWNYNYIENKLKSIWKRS